MSVTKVTSVTPPGSVNQKFKGQKSDECDTAKCVAAQLAMQKIKGFLDGECSTAHLAI